MIKNNLPVIILVRPQMGENIGSVARAMSNFGLHELRLVAPRDGWPNRRAKKTASGAEPLLKAAKLYPDVASAMADVHLAYATTARPRDMEKRVIEPAEAMREIKVHSASGTRVALVFGPERTGLDNEDITWCDTLITIPTAENASLNLAQSAVIVGYEWLRQQNVTTVARTLPGIAPKEDWHGLFTQLEAYLDQVNYYRVADKKTVMWQNLRNMLLRGQFSAQEVRSFRGMLRALWERRAKNSKEVISE